MRDPKVPIHCRPSATGEYQLWVQDIPVLLRQPDVGRGDHESETGDLKALAYSLLWMVFDERVQALLASFEDFLRARVQSDGTCDLTIGQVRAWIASAENAAPGEASPEESPGDAAPGAPGQAHEELVAAFDGDDDGEPLGVGVGEGVQV